MTTVVDINEEISVLFISDWGFLGHSNKIKTADKETKKTSHQAKVFQL
jgi:hypothetical protein